MFRFSRLIKVSWQSAIQHRTLKSPSNSDKPRQSIQFKVNSRIEDFGKKKSLAKRLEPFGKQQGKDEFSTVVFGLASAGILIFELVSGTLCRGVSGKLYIHEELKKEKKHGSADFLDLAFSKSKYYWHNLNQKSQSLLEQVAKDMKLDDDVLERFRVFYVDFLGVKGHHIWNVRGTMGGFTGIPFYASYEDKSEVNLKELRHKTNFFPWSKFDLSELEANDAVSEEDIAELKDTFVMSDNAKKFILASNAFESASSLVTPTRSTKLLGLASLFYFTTANINSFFKMFTHPFHVRLGVYWMVFPASAFLIAAASGKLRKFMKALPHVIKYLDISCFFRWEP